MPGRPDRLLLCPYLGFNHARPVGTLASRRMVSSPTVLRSIADEINSLTCSRRERLRCPLDAAERTLGFFGYPKEAPVVVEINLEGCPSVGNGRAPLHWLSSERLSHRLELLVPLPSVPPTKAKAAADSASRRKKFRPRVAQGSPVRSNG